MLRTSGANIREWYAEEFPVTDPCYPFQLKYGLVFKTKEQCEDAILDKVEREGGRLINYKPKRSPRKDHRNKVVAHA